MTLSQTFNHPNIASFVIWHVVLRDYATSLDIDPDDLINDPEKAATFANIMGMTNGNKQNDGTDQQQDCMGSTGGVPPGANPADATGAGGGNIGTGNVPQPGETDFTQAATMPRGPIQNQQG